MADDGFMGKDDRRDGGIERGGNGTGYAAPEESYGVGTAEIEDLAKAGAERGAEVYGGAISADGGAQADGAGANERCGDAFAHRHDAVVIDAGDNGVGRAVAARKFQGHIQQANKQSATGERGEDVPFWNIGEGALFVMKEQGAGVIRGGQHWGQIGLGIFGGRKVLALKLQLKGLGQCLRLDVNFARGINPLGVMGRQADAIARGDNGAAAVGGPLGLLETFQSVDFVASEIKLQVVAGIKLVSVSAAGTFAMIEVHPVHHVLEGFHKPERGIGNAGSNYHREYQQKQQVGAGLVRRLLLAIKEFANGLQHAV